MRPHVIDKRLSLSDRITEAMLRDWCPFPPGGVIEFIVSPVLAAGIAYAGTIAYGCWATGTYPDWDQVFASVRHLAFG